MGWSRAISKLSLINKLILLEPFIPVKFEIEHTFLSKKNNQVVAMQQPKSVIQVTVKEKI